MDTRLLNAFVVLADTGHFGEASKQLCISQPALTKQIKTLESQLDIVLFERGRHGAKLTQEGQLCGIRSVIIKFYYFTIGEI